MAPAMTDIWDRLERLALRMLPRPRRFDIVVIGDRSRRWVEALADDAPVWTGLDARNSVTLTPDGWMSPPLDWASARKRLVLPLREDNIIDCPRDCWTLVPSRRAVRIFGDKGRFARFVEAEGLTALVPQRYRSGAGARYPAVLKRTDLDSARGLVLVGSVEELRAQRARKIWDGQRVVIQEAVPGRMDYVTHCVAVDGRIVWHHSYAFELAHDFVLRGPRVTDHALPHEATRAELKQMERFLRPLRFTGPVNLDYKRGPGGIVVFEINPRLGGSLFREQNVADLRACLSAIAKHARWRPGKRRPSLALGTPADLTATPGEVGA